MRRLGVALHEIQGRLIVRWETEDAVPAPAVNSAVVDQKGARVGRLSDIFGPKDRPYFVVRPARGTDPAVQVGRKLYVSENSGRDSKWKR